MRHSRWYALATLMAAGTFLPACGGGGDQSQAQAAPAASDQTASQAAPAAAPADTATAAVAAAAPAQGAGPTIGEVPQGATMAMVQAGEKIFHGPGNCYTCHGADAKGTALAPNLTDTVWLNIDGSYQAIINTDKNGIPNPKQHPAPMPPMGGAQLTDQQIHEVAAYVYAISHPKK
jgi:mono/diheme cytochrome c family protein